ncbi:MAG: hypothetical protein AAF206_16080 [Bacteroidota bacterium]
MKHFLILLVCALVGSSCNQVECEAFDLNNPVTEWHLFPSAEAEYVFFAPNQENIILRKELDIISEAESQRCNRCACQQDFTLVYASRDGAYSFGSTVSYNSLLPTESGQLTYQFAQDGVLLATVNAFLSEASFPSDQTEDGPQLNPGITLRQSARVIFNFRRYDGALQIEIESGQPFEGLWIDKKVGLLGFAKDGILWARK